MTVLLLGCSGDARREAPPDLRFDRETVVLRIEADSLEVEAWYQLLCSPAERPNAAVFYPYPRDSLMGPARTVLVECRASGMEWIRVPWYARPPLGVRWTLPLDLGDTLTVHTIYRQALYGSTARYIVTTTRSWNRPLAHARFELHLPDGYDPVDFSHEFVEQPIGQGRSFVFETARFWPDRDILVSWSRVDQARSDQDDDSP